MFVALLKKYWMYLLIAIGAVFIILWLFVFGKPKGGSTREMPSEKSLEKLQTGITEVREMITEVDNKAKVEIAIARTKEENLKTELKKVKTEPDVAKRRARLASLAAGVL